MMVSLQDSAPAEQVPGVVPGAQEDRRHPPHAAADLQGPFFNDEFGDTFGNIYALTGDGFSYAELKEFAEIRNELLRSRTSRR